MALNGIQSRDCSRAEEEFTLVKLMQSISNIVGSLDITGSLIKKMNSIYSYASNRLTNYASFVKKDHSFTSEQITSGSRFRRTVGKNGVKPTSLKHSHSNSCINECRHDHHAKISSWRHSLSVHRSHIPRKLQEPYIEYGYLLPFMPWRYYLKSLYIPSYEFANIWTHLLPAIYFLYLLHNFSQEMDIVSAWPLLLITFSGVMLGIFSALAHLFHSRSSLHHSCWFVADYFGITLYAFSSLTTNFYSGAQLKYYKMLSANYLHITAVICSFGFTCLCLTQSNQKLVSTKISRQIKVLVNGFGYAFGALPLFQRIYENILEGSSELALQLHLYAVFGMVLAPVVYGLDVPQRFYPGKFDIFGHSHMWFHVVTALSMLFDINAVYFDIVEGPWKVINQEPDYPTFSGIAFYYCVLILYCVICGCITRYSIKCDYPEEEPFLQGKLLCSCGLPGTMRSQPSKKLLKSKTLPNIDEWRKRETFG